ncbi:class I SAM-dependent methyltransferase [Fodinicola acaciae]|uniref:class I SAM-dependent methyltransferase n=1 Tax=Fodinicola acaciae TaxID=2681555 RepID=UPI0013D32442|nr:class I SAM-dependent methyltransferase [Fodinicola acaciae]
MTHDISEQFDAAYWEERYSSGENAWSGNPNPSLVDEVSGLTPGRALDAGCGSGGDAIWLASRGWQVTAVDFAAAGLRRAAEAAGDLEISWQQHDLRSWTPGAGAYDLVTAHFVHFPPAVRDPLFRRLADAVAPGGTLLIVGHHPSDLETHVERPQFADAYYTAEDVAALLSDDWTIVTAAAPARTHHGIEIRDAVLRARRETTTSKD